MAQPGIDSESRNPPSKTQTSKEGHEDETVHVVATALVAWFTIIHTSDCYKKPSQEAIFGSHVSAVILLILGRKEWKAEGNTFKKICSVKKPPILSVNIRSQLLKYLQQPQLGFPHQEDVHPTVSNKTSFRDSSKIFKASPLALRDQ